MGQVLVPLFWVTYTATAGVTVGVAVHHYEKKKTLQNEARNKEIAAKLEHFRVGYPEVSTHSYNGGIVLGYQNEIALKKFLDHTLLGHEKAANIAAEIALIQSTVQEEAESFVVKEFNININTSNYQMTVCSIRARISRSEVKISGGVAKITVDVELGEPNRGITSSELAQVKQVLTRKADETSRMLLA